MRKKKPGPKPIQDKFTKLPVTRARKYQLRRMREGRCQICGRPREGRLTRCENCRNRDRERKLSDAAA